MRYFIREESWRISAGHSLRKLVVFWNIIHRVVEDSEVNRSLWSVGRRKKTGATGYVSYQDICQCKDCGGCVHLREKCTRSKERKQLYVSKKLIEKRNISLKNIQSPAEIRYCMNRSIQAEGAFGVEVLYKVATKVANKI